MHNLHNSYTKLYHVRVEYCNIFSFTLCFMTRKIIQLQAMALKHKNRLAKKYIYKYIFLYKIWYAYKIQSYKNNLQKIYK